jgi:hypothetical protein
VPASEIDSWLQYTSWNEVLGQSKLNLVKTHQFARAPDPGAQIGEGIESTEAHLRAVLGHIGSHRPEGCIEVVGVTQ